MYCNVSPKEYKLIEKVQLELFLFIDGGNQMRLLEILIVEVYWRVIKKFLKNYCFNNFYHYFFVKI